MTEKRSRSIAGVGLTKPLFIVSALLMPVLSACAVETMDDEEIEVVEQSLTDTDVQALGAGCQLLRPFAWGHPGVGCVESQHLDDPIWIPDGGHYDATAVPSATSGSGWARVACDDGDLVEEVNVCYKTGGGGGWEP